MNKISAEGFRTLLEGVPDGFFVHDETGRLLDLSERCCADLGYTRDELLGMSILDISGGEAKEANLATWQAARAGLSMSYRDVAVHKDGSRFPVEVRLTCQVVDDRKLFLGVALDVAEAESTDDRTADLRAAHERLAIAAAVGGLGIWDYDIARDAMQCDPQWYRIMGRDPARPVRSIAEFRGFIHPDDADRATEVHQAARRISDSADNYGIVFRIVRPDGEIRWIRSTASVVSDDAGLPVRAVGFVVDVTDVQHATARLEQQTREDPLTGLANRRRLDEELTKACFHATRTGEPLTLAMIDVDHFKLYNDAEGYVRGDEALKAVADILQSVARRPYDLAARYGGDEYLLMLPGVDEPEPILDHIIAELAKRQIAHRGSPAGPMLTISCGSVVAPELADVGPVELLKQCDRALYQAKAEGRNRVHVVRLDERRVATA
ncbi:sensor domain-containing diguanylate cyclase [Sphingopyxis macrogoltabida]|uniref:sensor domain-containing diguanylate cyclase n=1 Tax=Sphingopyxis macrogoltabida TaxID=33050 RepID=UPI0006CA85B3|nr:sensor domain-containing diguanylate cyclase [Sphingopyxis macrogoltabida]